METLSALIVEDEDDLVTIFTEALEMAGFHTEAIQDGGKAVQRLTEIVPDLVILDLHLPTVAGKDILKHIRADARLANTKVILATADAATAEMIEDQADMVLLKPISFKQLRDMATRLGTMTR